MTRARAAFYAAITLTILATAAWTAVAWYAAWWPVPAAIISTLAGFYSWAEVDEKCPWCEDNRTRAFDSEERATKLLREVNDLEIANRELAANQTLPVPKGY